MKILVAYRGIPQSRGWATGDSVVRALESMGHDVFPYGNYYQTQERLGGLDRNMLLNKEYDLLLFMECGDGDPVYSELVQVRTRKTVSWFFDIALYPSRWKQIVDHFRFDYNFVANIDYLDTVPNTHYLPYAADSKLHYRSPERNKVRRFAFVGSDRPERREMSTELGIQLKSGIFREEYIDYLADSEYVINDIAGGGHGLISMRPFEALMAGSKLITPKIPDLTMPVPCIEYTNLAHLKQILEQPKLDASSLDGQLWVCMKHTYVHRCEQIIKTVFNED